MEEKKTSENFMVKLAAFIVNKRKAFIALFALACVYSAVSISKVGVVNDLTEYLPETTETRQGLDIMNREFTTFGSAKVLVSNITYDKALALSKEIGDIRGISGVTFFDQEEEHNEDEKLEDTYKDASALYSITFEEEEDTELSQAAMAQLRETLEGYSSYVYTTVDKDDAAALKEDMRVIVVIVIFIILVVLLFTSKTYMEIVIFLAVFGVAALLNMGTNYWFGEISFVTNAVGAVLQLALAIDYAIILFHRFMEEHEDKETIEAITVALSKAIPEISSSSLTTVSGMVALMFMQFGIGMDLGRVLTKAIILSLLTVFLFMPALIVMFSRAIDRTVHPNFVPTINFWGKFVVALRYIGVPVFLVIVAAASKYSGLCPYIYDVNSVESSRKNEFMASKERIQETFEVTNTMAIVVPKGDYEKEGKILKRLEAMDEVDTALGLANVEVSEDNLNTHKPASLYKRYPPEEARRITKKLEIHYTPKHGSWLDIAEIELNVMTRQCLSRRIAEIGLLRRELSAWETERNTLAAKVNWHFRTSDARTKLSSLYPTFTTAS